MSFLHPRRFSSPSSMRRRRHPTMTRNDTDETCVGGSSFDKQGSLESNPSFDLDSISTGRRFTKESIDSSTSWMVKKQRCVDSWRIVKTESIEEGSPSHQHNSRRGTKETLVSTRASISWSVHQRDTNWGARGSVDSEPSFDMRRERGRKETIRRSVTRQKRFDLDTSEDVSVKEATFEKEEDFVNTSTTTSTS